jgi:hypothetical protein
MSYEQQAHQAKPRGETSIGDRYEEVEEKRIAIRASSESMTAIPRVRGCGRRWRPVAVG